MLTFSSYSELELKAEAATHYIALDDFGLLKILFAFEATDIDDCSFNFAMIYKF